MLEPSERPYRVERVGYRPASFNNQPDPLRLTSVDPEMLVYNLLARHGMGVLRTLGSQGSSRPLAIASYGVVELSKEPGAGV